jgi:hypothetical protein
MVAMAAMMDYQGREEKISWKESGVMLLLVRLILFLGGKRYIGKETHHDGQ